MQARLQATIHQINSRSIGVLFIRDFEMWLRSIGLTRREETFVAQQTTALFTSNFALLGTPGSILIQNSIIATGFAGASQPATKNLGLLALGNICSILNLCINGIKFQSVH